MSFGKRCSAILLVQALVGYEWFASGLTKLVHGDFPGGLRSALGEMSGGAPGFYRSFLETAVIPHAQAFGYAVELGELLLGVVLIGGAALAVLGRGGRGPALALVAAAAGLFLAVNLELANGAHFGLPIAGDSFDEGIDLDTIMVGLQLVLLGSAVAALRVARPRVSVARIAHVFASLR